MAADTSKTCYVTLVMSDSYLPGAMVLAHSLRDTGSKRRLVAMVTMETLSIDVIHELKTMYELLPVPRIANQKPGNLYLMGRGDLLYALSKIAIWRQTQFEKVLYLDADIVVIQNLDHLFDLDVPFAAAPDAGWPDAFNSGVMLVTPDIGDYHALYTLAQSGDSFDGADQGLLNQYYEHKNWHRLSFLYNTTPNAEYQWEPAYRYHKSNIKAAHFIGRNKPWFVGRSHGNQTGVYGELVGKWWSTYDRHYRQSSDYVPNKSYVRSRAVQERVWGEVVDMYNGVPEEERLPPPASTDIAPTVTVNDAAIDDSYHGSYQGVPQLKIQEPSPELRDSDPLQDHQTSEPDQSEFKAPEMEWDATRTAPPPKSRPEAEHFPTHHYTFEQEQKPFKAPSNYAPPPKDMYYSVPQREPSTEEPPTPIFPWEHRRTRSRATRIFSEDLPATPPSETQNIGSPPTTTWQESSGGMEQYLRNIFSNQRTREKESKGKPEPTSQRGRRESLVFVGMPAQEDRPSLPVTPAPIMTNTFWGDEGDDTDTAGTGAKGGNPSEGEGGKAELPDQVEWNPNQALEGLRRSSLVEMESLVLAAQAAAQAKSAAAAASSSSGESTGMLATKDTETPGTTTSANTLTSNAGASGVVPLVAPTYPLPTLSTDSNTPTTVVSPNALPPHAELASETSTKPALSTMSATQTGAQSSTAETSAPANTLQPHSDDDDMTDKSASPSVGSTSAGDLTSEDQPRRSSLAKAAEKEKMLSREGKDYMIKPEYEPTATSTGTISPDAEKPAKSGTQKAALETTEPHNHVNFKDPDFESKRGSSGVNDRDIDPPTLSLDRADTRNFEGDDGRVTHNYHTDESDSGEDRKPVLHRLRHSKGDVGNSHHGGVAHGVQMRIPKPEEALDD